MQAFNLNQIQSEIRKSNISGWLFCSFEHNDPISERILKVDTAPTPQKRWYYYIPGTGIPVKIIHSVDHTYLDHLPGKKEIYFSWREMEEKLRNCFNPADKVALQYSPQNAVPYISRIDAGTLEFLKKCKIKPVSSADLAQIFEVRLTNSQINTQISAGKILENIFQSTQQFMVAKLSVHEELSEIIIQQFVMTELQKKNLVFTVKPIVASGKNTGNPYYVNDEFTNHPIFPEKLILIEIGARLNEENSVFAVKSKLFYTGEKLPEKYATIFKHIVRARDEIINFINNSVKKRKIIKGFQVDDTCRKFFGKKGYENNFLHRSGHSVGKRYYDTGANLDNLESRDERLLIDSSSFTIQPGIYYSEFGIRSVLTALKTESGIKICTLPLQNSIELIPIKKD